MAESAAQEFQKVIEEKTQKSFTNLTEPPQKIEEILKTAHQMHSNLQRFLWWCFDYMYCDILSPESFAERKKRSYVKILLNTKLT